MKILKKILDNIWKNFKNKTIIQVTHNPKILSNCDEVFKLVNNGKLIKN